MSFNLISLITRRSLSYAQNYSRQHVEGAMNSLVIVTRSGAFNPDTGEYDPTNAVVLYDDADYPGVGGQAGVTPTSGPINFSGGDEAVFFDSITVYIPKYMPIKPRIGDVIQVMAGPDNNVLGRFFRVTSVPAGGRLVPSNAMQASGLAPSRQWVQRTPSGEIEP